jgi:hypothetical protein
MKKLLAITIMPKKLIGAQRFSIKLTEYADVLHVKGQLTRDNLHLLNTFTEPLEELYYEIVYIGFLDDLKVLEPWKTRIVLDGGKKETFVNDFMLDFVLWPKPLLMMCERSWLEVGAILDYSINPDDLYNIKEKTYSGAFSNLKLS